MAISLGKLSIIVGAGIVTSIIAKEDQISDFVSGAVKLLFRQLKRDDSTASVKKPRNDSLMAQVDSLRQELQILASNRQITIVNGRGTGNSKYGLIVIVVVVGYGYVWWKGWRLPDMMFATRRSLSDARDAIAKQLESVYSSISTTRRHLSSRIDTVDNHLGEISDITTTTHNEVSIIQDKSRTLNSNVQSVRDVVLNLSTKINRIEVKQDFAIKGIGLLRDVAEKIEQNKSADLIQASPASSSRPAIEAPKTPVRTESLPPLPGEVSSSDEINMTESLPTNLPREVSSPPEVNRTHTVKRFQINDVYGSGLKDFHDSSGNLFGSTSSGGNAILTRTHSAITGLRRQQS